MIDVDWAREAGEVLGDPSVDVEELAHAKRMSVTAQVCRVRGAHGTAVVKVISSGEDGGRWAGSDDPAHPWFWRREPSLYEDGLPGPYLDAGLRAPTLLARFERRGGMALWLEDLAGRPGSPSSTRPRGRDTKRGCRTPVGMATGARSGSGCA